MNARHDLLDGIPPRLRAILALFIAAGLGICAALALLKLVGGL